MSNVVNEWRHGRKDVGATAERIATQQVGYQGLMLTADSTNTVPIYLGATPNVTADTDEDTGGVPLMPGSTKSFPLESPHLVFAIAASPDQGLSWSLF